MVGDSGREPGDERLFSVSNGPRERDIYLFIFLLFYRIGRNGSTYGHYDA